MREGEKSPRSVDSVSSDSEGSASVPRASKNLKHTNVHSWLDRRFLPYLPLVAK